MREEMSLVIPELTSLPAPPSGPLTYASFRKEGGSMSRHTFTFSLSVSLFPFS